MALFRRGDVWWMRFNYQGKQIRRSTEVSDRKLAERIYHKVRGQIAEGKWFERQPGEDKTVQELMDRYLHEYSSVNKAATTHKRDISLSAHLTQAFGSYSLTSVRPSMLSEYKTGRRLEGAAPKTVNDELKLLSHAYKLATMEWEWVTENPVLKVSREKVRNSIERWLTQDEEKRLLAASCPWLREILLFALHTGLRQSEILNLQWLQVDLFRRTLTILEQKNGSKDTLPLNDTALEVLTARVRVKPLQTGYVFANEVGNRRDARNLLRAFYPALTEAKIDTFRFHDLRHTWATRLVQAGVDLYVVQKLGRWKTITMVMRYAHHYPESLRAGAEVLDRLRKESSTKLAQSVEKAQAIPAQAIENVGAPGRN